MRWWLDEHNEMKRNNNAPWKRKENDDENETEIWGGELFKMWNFTTIFSFFISLLWLDFGDGSSSFVVASDDDAGSIFELDFTFPSFAGDDSSSDSLLSSSRFSAGCFLCVLLAHEHGMVGSYVG